MILFCSISFGGFLIIPLIAMTFLSEEQAIKIALFWVIPFFIIQFLIFNCPYCGKSAIFTPKGIATPFVGSKCRFCDKEY